MADIYPRRLDEARALAPAVKTYDDYRRLLDDKSIDAVLIATPQHQHALSFVAAIEAGKDVYQEKTMAFNPGHAKRMRAAFTGSGPRGASRHADEQRAEHRQDSGVGRRRPTGHDHGHPGTPLPQLRLTAAGSGRFRLTAMPEHVDWPAFEGEAKHYAFDPQRYVNWRFYWDYSGGNCL